MIKSNGYAAQSAETPLAPFAFERRSPGSNDVAIEILYCGVCHSDIHQARNEWGGSIFPMVPGHEIVGRVAQAGEKVSKFKVGDLVGVGCFVDSCRSCPSCKEGLEQYCEGHVSFTYNGTEQDKTTPTYGGYSNNIVVDQDYVVRVPSNLKLEAVAPLLCAGITTYSPLRHWKVGKGHKLGVVGLGGLGHMAVKFGVSFGAEVTVISSTKDKEADSKKLGAHHFLASRDEAQMAGNAASFDFIIDTVSAPHDMNAYLGLLKRDGVLILVGVPEKPLDVHAFSLIPKRRTFSGSMIGGIKETQEMLDYCGKHSIVSDVEVISIATINEAYTRMIKGDVRYRFVIDTKSLAQ